MSACARNKCKEKVWKYRSKNRDEQISSIHCKNHTCRSLSLPLAISNATDTEELQRVFCTEVAREGRRYCGEHLHCPVENCGRQRINMEKVRDPPLCMYHKCIEHDCPKAAANNSRKCQDHWDRCQLPLPGCRHQVAQKVDRKGSYCSDHTCEEKRCLILSYERWCPDHRPCAAAYCTRMVVRVETPFKQDLYCQDHWLVPCGACQANRVFNPAPVGETNCIAHRCRELGCGSQRVQRGSVDTFPKEYKEYCEKHNCHADDCPLPIFELEAEGKDASKYCQTHECECTTPSAESKKHQTSHIVTSTLEKLEMKKERDDDKQRKEKEIQDAMRAEEDEKRRKEKEREEKEKAEYLETITGMGEKIAGLEEELRKEQTERKKEQEKRANELSQSEKAKDHDEKTQTLETIKQMKRKIADLEAENKKEKMERSKEQQERADEERKRQEAQAEVESRNKEKLEKHVSTLTKLLDQKLEERESKPQADRAEWENFKDQIVSLVMKSQESERRSVFDNNMFSHIGAGVGSTRQSESNYGSLKTFKDRKN
ncbi:hypothetical protein L207DRAFT_572442 [Hyaloscypha variabilis F]|uniref:Uncharacterized protein n=1 Tax=Hyaloscypha variabilis (strain UAMH 11265 / GT02V1 / F) TaxID=1149755 RepID=A0A2J6R0Z9_HYAVF|nr:hypothetical protein L207DRAFT_572442 [Hyaloscypha variabilis F]